MEIAAERLVEAHPEAVSTFLADLENHWRLADRFVELVSIDADGDGGVVRLRGPLPVQRTARTRLELRSRQELGGTAVVGRRTRATLRWTLRPSGAGTFVRLEASVDSVALTDRLLLALGGRWWLRSEFGAAIDRVGCQLARPEEGRRPIPAALPTALPVPAAQGLVG